MLKDRVSFIDAKMQGHVYVISAYTFESRHAVSFTMKGLLPCLENQRVPGAFVCRRKMDGYVPDFALPNQHVGGIKG